MIDLDKIKEQENYKPSAMVRELIAEVERLRKALNEIARHNRGSSNIRRELRDIAAKAIL